MAEEKQSRPRQNFELPKFEEDEPINVARIKVVGVGGGGNAAVSRMVQARIKGVEFIAVNTDLQALATCSAPIKVQIGKETTGGLGSGADPEIGRKAIEENKEEGPYDSSEDSPAHEGIPIRREGERRERPDRGQSPAEFEDQDGCYAYSEGRA